MDEEMKSLERMIHENLSIVHLERKQLDINGYIQFKFVYQVDDMIKRFKARLVAKRYSQAYEIDNRKIFTPVVKFNTI